MRNATFKKFYALATELVSVYGGQNVNSSEIIRFWDRYKDNKGFSNHNYFTQCQTLKVSRGVIYIPKTLAEYEELATGEKIGAMVVNFTPDQSTIMAGGEFSQERKYGPIIEPMRHKTIKDVMEIMTEPDEEQEDDTKPFVGQGSAYVPAAKRMKF